MSGQRTMGVKVIGIAAAIISLATAIGVVVWAQEKMTNDAAASIKQATIVLAEQVELSFVTLNRSLRFFEQSLRDRNLIESPYYQEVYDLVETAGHQPPAIDSLSIIDSEGFIETNSRVFSLPPTDVSDKEYFVALRDRTVLTPSKMLVGAPIVGVFSKKKLIPVARRLEKDEKFQGVIVGYLDYSYFDSIFSRVYRPATGLISLDRGDNVPLAKWPEHGEVIDDAISFREAIPEFNLVVGMKVAVATLREPWRPVLIAVVLSALLTSILILILTTFATKRILQEQDWSGIKRKAGELLVVRGGKSDE